jgi:hypothetical protein
MGSTTYHLEQLLIRARLTKMRNTTWMSKTRKIRRLYLLVYLKARQTLLAIQDSHKIQNLRYLRCWRNRGRVTWLGRAWTASMRKISIWRIQQKWFSKTRSSSKEGLQLCAKVPTSNKMTCKRMVRLRLKKITLIITMMTSECKLVSV